MSSPRSVSGDPWGAELQLSYDGLRISKVDPGSPSDGHLAVGDVVVAINGQITRYMSLSKAQAAMAKGKQVSLKVQRSVILRESRPSY